MTNDEQHMYGDTKLTGSPPDPFLTSLLLVLNANPIIEAHYESMRELRSKIESSELMVVKTAHAELIQRFVDHNAKWAGKGCIEADIEWDAIVSDCIAGGFKPSNP